MSDTGSKFFSKLFAPGSPEVARGPASLDVARGMNVIDPDVIETGDMFWQPGTSASWRVERTCKLAFTEATHAVLQRVDRWGDQLSGDTKVIAVESLLDPTQYQRERRQSNGDDSGSRRRRGDAPKAN